MGVTRFVGGGIAGLAGVFFVVAVAAVLGIVLRALAYDRCSGFYTRHRG